MFNPPRPRGIEKYLAPGEGVQLITRRHPVLLVKPILLWITVLLVVGTISFWITASNPIPLVDQVTFWLALLMSVYTGYRLLAWWRAYYVVTDERVLLLEGVISISVSTVRLARVTETSFARSLWGRVLGYGVLKLDSAGEQLSLASLSYLPRPEAVYRLVTSLLLGVPDSSPPARYLDPSEETTGPLPPVVL